MSYVIKKQKYYFCFLLKMDNISVTEEKINVNEMETKKKFDPLKSKFFKRIINRYLKNKELKCDDKSTNY